MSPTDRILRLLSERPGLRAQQIAAELGLERSEAAALLFGLSGEVTQDSSYRWWPKNRGARTLEEAYRTPTFLTTLCRYYLACLSQESGLGIGILAADPSAYVELKELPFAHPGRPWGADRVARKLAQKVRRERGQLTLYLGFAVRLRSVLLKDGDELRAEPVLLYPIEERADEPGELRPSSLIPLFNLDVLKTLPSVDSGNVIDEAIQLSEELGLTNSEEDLPPWDELILRLQQRRPEWGWKEDLNPYAPSADPPLAKLTAPGIYNRAVLFAGTRSPFTYGLETELRKLAQFDESAIRGTALGAWLQTELAGDAPAPVPDDRPILEVLPLNTEQRQAVVQGLAAPMTVVTGPPGTGKSQVVTSLLANVAWQSHSALFSSKNNHAVDVVESRVNGLGSHPLLLRLGKEDHHARIAQHLTAALSESANPSDAAAYEWLARAHEADRARYDAIQREIAAVVSLRNAVDELERAVEPARALFGERFRSLRDMDTEAAAGRLQAFSAALDAAGDPAQSSMARLLRDPMRSRRFERVTAAAEDLRSAADALEIALPSGPPEEGDLDRWKEFRNALAGRLEWGVRVRNYWQSLDRLRAARPIENLAGELTRIAEESARNSIELWQCWLRLRPARWNLEERKLLGEYVALLQIIAGGMRGEETGSKVFRRYYSLFPKVVKLLPCWAVTSLSARGRLPLEPAIFDLVVIDEASQCDIASALPLLYRARRAVIIGDPLQLKHVSTVAPQQDRLLLAAHGLAEGRAAWAYSVNSLFDLARSLCRVEDIVNLREHHRSHRDIIAFPNRHFYRGRLRIATDHDALRRPRDTGPAVLWIDVRGKVLRPSGGGAMNSVEAQALVGELADMVKSGYDGAIGVVTPFRAQANKIRTLVHQDRELSQSLASLSFVVDTVHGFQGDEREVIFFSPVISAGAGESTLRFLKSHGNLFNVAITRARSELIVVGDRQAALDSGVAYLAGFAEYVRDLAAQENGAAADWNAGPDYPVVAHPELVSDWERIFYKAMHLAGLRPVPQYEEPPDTLDFALFDGERKLNIEVDGENYHRNWDGELCRRDQIRSRRLGDRSWDVMRFWVYELRDDMEAALRRVKEWKDG
jgi:very-short-patch-repair endonuclease